MTDEPNMPIHFGSQELREVVRQALAELHNLTQPRPKRPWYKRRPHITWR